MRAIILPALGILAWSFSVEAGVIYRWQNLQPNALAGPASGILEIKDEVWRSGRLDWSADVDEFGPAITGAAAPLERLEFSVPDLPDPWVLPLAPCSSVLASGCAGPADGTTVVAAGFVGVFDLTLGPRLTGAMWGQFDNGGGGSTFQMSANASGIWTLGGVVGDGGDDCGGTPNACSGGTGYWLLDRTSIPEPGGLALLALGGLALAAARRIGRRSA